MNTVKLEKGTLDVPSFTFQRAYMDAEKQWQHTQSFKVNDLARLQVVLDEASAYLLKKEYAKTDEDTE
jgi:hypothetical protein